MTQTIWSDHDLWLRALEVMGPGTRIVLTREWVEGLARLTTAKVTLAITHPQYRTLKVSYLCDTHTCESSDRHKALANLELALAERDTFLKASPGGGSRKREQ